MDDERASSMAPKTGADSLESAVGEHSGRRRRITGRYSGASGKENVGMSNDNAREKSAHRKPKVS